MGKKGSVIVSPRDIKNRVSDTNKEEEQFTIYRTQNVYLSAFLISQENFSLGRVYIEDLARDNKAWVEIKYDPKYQKLFENYADVYGRGKAVVNLNCYQQNIRFVMHLINMRKSGIN